MFIQVIEGSTKDPDALHQRLEAWERDLKPGAVGYLGSTGGVTADGHCILVARFESRDAAMRNSARPEQDAWWRETEKCFDGTPTFHDSEEVEIMQHGTIDRARFVQVMEGHVTDRERARQLEQEADPVLADVRPDVLGSVTAYFDDDAFANIVYFTSEADARQAESGEMPDQMAGQFQEWQKVMPVDRYLDISEPWLTTA